ncbi:MAG: hypothetical protein LBH76_04370 [Propionibacteriaceae bacterium]|jgi:beta-glucuronidase|nr:hypothetical protein [Propionibacteriaceae bacterium]
MTSTDPANFQANIHRADYLAPYEGRSAPPAADGPAPVEATAATLVDLARRPVTWLDGDWHFAIDPYDTCLRARWFDEPERDPDGRPLPLDHSFEAWPTVPVPSCWNTLKPEWLWYEGSAVYVRDFAAEPTAPGERQFLHFEGANYAAYVFLNRRYVGWHRGGSTPFSFEVTGQLQASNRLLVVVNDTRRPERVPTDNTDWFNYGGLHRSVGLLRVPASFVRTAAVALVADAEPPTAAAPSAIAVDITVDGPETAGEAVAAIPELGLTATFAVSDGRGRATLTAPAGSLTLWEPAHPRLYDVVVSYAGDTWSERVGFRDLRVVGSDILLNGRPLYLKGVSQHEDSVERGRSLTEADIRHNFALARDMGCTYVRLAHYPHARAAAQVADELGLLLWEEIPVYWAIDFANPATAREAQNQLSELIARDRNRAAVVIWSVGNENPDTDARLTFMSDLARLAKALDPTRLTSAACLVDPGGADGPVIADRLAEVIDIIGVNEYYGWYEPDFSRLPRLFENSRLTKPVIVSEFGADAVAGRRGPETEMFTEDHQLAVYRQQIAVLRTIPYVKGLSPWILYDFRCPRRIHQHQGYYNRKGLLDAAREHRKLAYGAMRAYYTERDD